MEATDKKTVQTEPHLLQLLHDTEFKEIINHLDQVYSLKANVIKRNKQLSNGDFIIISKSKSKNTDTSTFPTSVVGPRLSVNLYVQYFE